MHTYHTHQFHTRYPPSHTQLFYYNSHHPQKPGGGQPKSEDPSILQKRISQVYSLDEKSVVRKSHENPSIQQVYVEELGEPLEHKSHELLHTTYRDRSAETK